jgi:purine-nucleoside phosphorylase
VTDDAGRAFASVREWLGNRRPEVVVVLGSGLGGFTERLEDPRVLPYGSVPGMPAAAVAGHVGEFVAGRLSDREILVQRGRFHLYEGHDAAVIALPVRLAARLGARALILTNAAGGIHPTLAPGDLMLIADQVNLSFRNPLIGRVRLGGQIPDMSDLYDTGLRLLACRLA